MEIQEFLDKIGLSEEAKTLFWQIKLSEEVYQEWKTSFEKDVHSFFEKYKEEEKFEQTLLCFYIRYAWERQQWFREETISQDIYIQTMKDVSIWEKDYEKRNKKPGIKATPWIHFSLTGRLFRLGRLQFEPIESDRDLVVGGKRYPKGKKVLNVHIPEDGKMNKDACEESFSLAKDFFRDRGMGEEILFLCESWLLSPVLKKILRDDSNILHFQKRFQIYDVIYPFRQAEERIFGEIREHPESYPEETSLQKAFKQWLREHPEDIGMGMGVYML